MKAINTITYVNQYPLIPESTLPSQHPELTQRSGNEGQHGDLRQVREDEHGPQDSDRGENGSKNDGEERLHQVWVCIDTEKISR
jgi:hypothetical protein